MCPALFEERRARLFLGAWIACLRFLRFVWCALRAGGKSLFVLHCMGSDELWHRVFRSYFDRTLHWAARKQLLSSGRLMESRRQNPAAWSREAPSIADSLFAGCLAISIVFGCHCSAQSPILLLLIAALSHRALLQLHIFLTAGHRYRYPLSFLCLLRGAL